MCGLALRLLSLIPCLCVNLLHIYMIFFRQHCSNKQSQCPKQNGEEFKNGRNTTEIVRFHGLVLVSVLAIFLRLEHRGVFILGVPLK